MRRYSIAQFKLGDLTFTALGDRILIREDEFKSGYECDACGGSGAVTCEACKGTGQSRVVSGARCTTCEGSGKLSCGVCGGKGCLLAVPETAQRRPTSGTVVSVGEWCKTIKVGDSVMYSNFSGYVIDLERADGKTVLRVLHESELLCKLSGHLELRSLKTKTDLAPYQQ